MKIKQTGLTTKVWIALITFGLCGQIAWIIVNMYFNVFLYRDVTQNPNVMAIMIGASAGVATITTLLMGVLSDRKGRRKPFVVYGYILWGLVIASFALVSTENVERLFPGADVVMVTATIVVLMCCVITFFGSTANDAAFNAWVTDVTNFENRGRADGLLATMPLLALLIVFGALDGLTRSGNWAAFYIIIGAVVTLGGIAGHFFLKDEENIKVEKTDFFFGFRPHTIKENKELYLIFIILAICCIAQQVYFPFILIYIEFFLGIEDYALILGVVLTMAGILSVLGGRLIDRYGKKRFFYIYNGVFTIGLFLTFIHGRFLISEDSNILVFLIVAQIIMIGGNMLMVAVLNASIRDYMPEAKRGYFNGIRLIFFVLFPMVTGPFIGARIIMGSGATYLDEFGHIQTVPNPELFLGAGIIALLLFIPLVFIIPKLYKGERL
jgi:MFS family permease